MFLIFLFYSAPEEGLYCKPKYRANFFLINKYISVVLDFVVYSIELVISASWDQSAVSILYFKTAQLNRLFFSLLYILMTLALLNVFLKNVLWVSCNVAIEWP